MPFTIELAERNLVPRPVLRLGIRQLLKQRLAHEAQGRSGWLAEMARADIALVPEAANAQHYEVPPAFFAAVLGRHLKYSSAYFAPGVTDLDVAETAMLELTCTRAELADGQRILELGCGWGSLTLFMAARLPNARIVAVSNSRPQRDFIMARALARGLTNVEVITADMNSFAATGRFDRVVSVEMFEHMRNWGALLTRVRSWLHDDGRFFQHVFAHREYAYPFADEDDSDWMARHFFSGGMMPSVDLLDRIASPLAVLKRDLVSGTHYARTAAAWLANLDARADHVQALFARDLGARRARRQVHRWRLFFLACEELFGWDDGHEWLVVHSLLAPRSS